MKEISNTKKSTKNKKRFIIIISALIILLLLLNLNKKISLKNETSLIIENENVTKKLQDEIIIKDNSKIYLSIEDIKNLIDNEIYIEDKKIIMCSERKVAAMEIDNSTIEINGATKEVDGEAFKTEEGKIYLPISELQNVYDLQFSYIEKYKNIIIDYYSKKMEKAYTSKNVLLTDNPKMFAGVIEEIKKGEWVVYISEENGWAKVRSQNGNIGYIKKNKLTNFFTEREDVIYQNKKEFSKEEYLEKSIKSSEIKKYENRKKIIEKIIEEAVNKKKRAVKIKFDGSKDSSEYKKFKIEATAVLKECGIFLIE